MKLYLVAVSPNLPNFASTVIWTMSGVTAEQVHAALRGCTLEQGSSQYAQVQKKLAGLIKSGGERAKELNAQDPQHVRLYGALSDIKASGGGRVALKLVLDWKSTIVRKSEQSKSYMVLLKGAVLVGISANMHTRTRTKQLC